MTYVAPQRLASIEVLPDYRLRVRFLDGTEGLVDLSARVRSPEAGVFAALADPDLFAKASVHLGAVTWPGELDLAPDAMHAAIRQTGVWALT
jgi:Protein of unknown function (DUF2442)